uniref:zinc finger domain-containing protein n=1 Tax=Devosia sp. XK-2 TaxID=3126689 RepID=UPI00403F0C05
MKKRFIMTYARMGISRDMASGFSCRRCGAAGGLPCIGSKGQFRIQPHIDRYKAAAKALAGGQ